MVSEHMVDLSERVWVKSLGVMYQATVFIPQEGRMDEHMGRLAVASWPYKHT